MSTKPLGDYCQHGHQMAPGDLLARYCHGCLWEEIARLTAEVERLQTVVDAAREVDATGSYSAMEKLNDAIRALDGKP